MLEGRPKNPNGPERGEIKMNKKIKRALAILTVALHILTFGGPVQAVDVLNGTVLKGDVNNPEGSTLGYNIVDINGNPVTDGRAGLSGNSFFNAGNVNFGGGDWLLAFQNFVNQGNMTAAGNLLITTLGADAAQFFAGMANLNQNPEGPGRFFNSGSIVANGDWLAIAAGTFQNVGTLSAGGGVVGISAGSQHVTFPLTQDGVISMEVNDSIAAEVYDKDGKKISDVWKNDGTIKGSVVIVKARGAEEAFDNIINHTGIIEAQTIGEKDGKIVLDGGDEGIVRVNGTLDASGRDAGEKGGKVHVLGKKVGLFEKARIDVSGDAGGGEVLVGGDYQGKGAVRNADFTYMDKDAEILADAIVNGNGGKVILWANNATRAYGTISAKGGALSGNGGFVETSGDYLDMDGIKVSTSAAHGVMGNYLLDPKFIEIVDAGGTGYANNTNNKFANNAGGTSYITAASLNSVGTNITLQANTDVTFTDAVNMTTSGASLTVSACRDILINNNITTKDGAVNFTANTYINPQANRDAGTGDIVMASGTTINAGSGDITFIVGANATAPFAPGFIAVAALITTGSLELNSQGSITQSGALTITGTTDIRAAGDVTLDHAGNDFVGAVSVKNGNNVALTDKNGIDLGKSTVNGNLDVTSSGGLSDIGDLTVYGTTTLAAGAGNNITLSNNNDFNTVIITNTDNVVLIDKNGINFGTSNISGTLQVTAGGLIDFTGTGASTVGALGLTTTAGGINDSGSGSLTVTGATGLAAGAGNNITLNNNNNDFSSVSVTSGKNVTLADKNAINLDTVTVSGNSPVNGNLSVTAGGLIDFIGSGATTIGGTMGLTTTAGGIADSGAGTLAVTGVTTLAAGAGNDITLNNANNFSTVGVTTGRDVVLNDKNEIILGASTVFGTLGVTANGAITDSGALSVTGTTTLAAGAVNSITLNNANDFSTVVVTSGKNVTLADTNAIDLDNSTVSGDLSVTAAGLIDFTGGGASTVGGTMGLTTTAGGISDSGGGTLAVTGMSTINATGAGNDIALNNANDFSTVKAQCFS
jgi:hypothetical protein